MNRIRIAVADVLLAIAERLTPAVETPRPFFNEDLDEVMSDGQWAGLIILHAEAVHGCEHTTQARAGIGMHGPRGQAVAS